MLYSHMLHVAKKMALYNAFNQVSYTKKHFLQEI